jgi:class 3 adenylate cyclase
MRRRGSTALSARMDPEDLREVISAYQKCVGEIVQLFGGFVAKYMGDGVLIYFGYPQAHEEGQVRIANELRKVSSAAATSARLAMARSSLRRWPSRTPSFSRS